MVAEHTRKNNISIPEFRKYCKHIIYILIKHYGVHGKEDLYDHYFNKTIPNSSNETTQILEIDTSTNNIETNINNKINTNEYDSLGLKPSAVHIGKIETAINDQLDWKLGIYKKKKIFGNQEGDYNCGVYVCMFAKSLAKNTPINKSRINNETVEQFKNEMLNDFIEKNNK
ncbi:hypothetical protein ACTA71_000261 [Dictyostelium dimigraforme]